MVDNLIDVSPASSKKSGFSMNKSGYSNNKSGYSNNKSQKLQKSSGNESFDAMVTSIGILKYGSGEMYEG